MLIFLLILIVVIALWWGLTQYNAASLDNLRETGFEVDYTLEGSPQVVFDKDLRKLAFVTLKAVIVYDYDQVIKWEWETTTDGGWSNKSEGAESQEVVFYLKDDKNPSIRVTGFNNYDVKKWQSQLDAILNTRSSGS